MLPKAPGFKISTTYPCPAVFEKKKAGGQMGLPLKN
jgi:hypothetical protein